MSGASGDAACVSLRSVAKRYSRRGPWVLRDLDADIEPGAVIELRGSDGVGKSTLLRLLVGATVPSRGARVAAPLLRVGYAPDQLAPPRPFTAADYLAHHARVRRIDERAGVEQSAALAERLGFAHLLTRRFAAMSTGTQQKVLLTQALLGEPGLVVLDEPYSNLDADARRAVSVPLEVPPTITIAQAFDTSRPSDAGDHLFDDVGIVAVFTVLVVVACIELGRRRE